MRLVTWNCAGALRRKTTAVDALAADIIVVQECEDPARSEATYADWAGSYVWAGANKNRGVGVFVRHGLAVEPLDWDGEGLATFLPVSISGLTLVAVWTQAAAIFPYVGQLWHYLARHRSLLRPDSIVCGDFNSNAIWDRPRRDWNHSDCVRVLGEHDLVSLYHHTTGETHGSERRPTFYLHRNAAKPFHLDYVFARGCRTVTVGDPAEWLALSDHMPLIVDL